MAWYNRDWRFHKLVPREARVDVFMALGRLMSWWREDPDKLAVAVTAYEALGYTMAAFEIEHGRLPDDTQMEQWSTERCYEAINGALRGRPRRVLRARAYGLLMGLVELAPAAERDRLHAIQVDARVIECRRLSTDERVAALREEG